MNPTINLLCRDMDDLTFEREIAQIRAARQAHLSGIAYVKKMNEGTFGLYNKYESQAARSPARKLLDTFIDAGLSFNDAASRVRNVVPKNRESVAERTFDAALRRGESPYAAFLASWGDA